ncbi:hypothetical protein [Jongsikchunia kroppenstedtii]|uniref:hypothetical protein n=1 Tax=Jongsikchunia kroppenstedtii TaxID=1121721 RepID=UPI0003720E1C|nr:hypothetical protein [Jongsikchunia kroppenstedtii]
MNHATQNLITRITGLISAIDTDDDTKIEAAVLRLSRSRRWLAPLALAVSTLVMLFHGLRIVFSNWRLVALMMPPTIWLWLAMFDLRTRLLGSREHHELTGAQLWLACSAVVVITIVVYASNTIMVIAVSSPAPHPVGPAFDRAKRYWRQIVLIGFAIGVILAFGALVLARWRPTYFVITLSIGVALLMLSYLSGPARMLGMKPQMSLRDKLVTATVTAGLSAILSAPGYAIARTGVFLMGVHPLFIFGLLILIIGVTLHAGAGGAVKAVKVSAVLLTGSDDAPRATI